MCDYTKWGWKYNMKILLTEKDIENLEDGFTITKLIDGSTVKITYCGHKGEIKNGVCLECGKETSQ